MQMQIDLTSLRVGPVHERVHQQLANDQLVIRRQLAPRPRNGPPRNRPSRGYYPTKEHDIGPESRMSGSASAAPRASGDRMFRSDSGCAAAGKVPGLGEITVGRGAASARDHVSPQRAVSLSDQAGSQGHGEQLLAGAPCLLTTREACIELSQSGRQLEHLAEVRRPLLS